MVRPLYPPRKKAPPPPPPLWKNPQLIGIGAIVLVLIIVFVYHFFSSGVIDPAALPAGQEKDGFMSFLKPSSYFKSDSKVADIQKEKLTKMGINESVDALNSSVEAKDLREQRRILAMRKFEASRQTAVRKEKEKEVLRRKLNSPTSLQLKDAIMALEASDNLGIMKLERLLEEKLHESGAKSEDLDVIIYAYDSLAKVYESKNMQEKAKESYVNAFKLMKKRAPPEQGPDWDNAIDNVEQMKTKSRNN